MTLHQEMINRLKNKKEIIFGPIIGSLELETTIWAGFIRNYKISNPKKRIIVLTRADRVDLYNNCVHHIMTFEIPYENEKFAASGHTLHLIGDDSLTPINTDEIEEFLLKPAIEKFPDAHIENLSKIVPTDALFFAMSGQNNLFEPRAANFNEIHNIIKHHIDKKWILIDPFSEINNSFAQWEPSKWTLFFKHLSLSNVVAMLPDFENISNTPTNKNFINLSTLLDNKKSSKIGLLIEAIKLSDLVIGTRGITKELASYFNIPYDGLKYDSNPSNIAYQVDKIISDKLSIPVTYNPKKIIQSNFSNFQGSSHLINKKTSIKINARNILLKKK